MKNFRFEMTKVYSGLPAPPEMKNFRFEMTKVYSGLPPVPPNSLPDRDPPPRTESRVKTLPFRNFVAGGNNTTDEHTDSNVTEDMVHV